MGHDKGAARMEATPGRWIQRAWHLPFYSELFLGSVRVIWEGRWRGGLGYRDAKPWCYTLSAGPISTIWPRYITQTISLI